MTSSYYFRTGKKAKTVEKELRFRGAKLLDKTKKKAKI